MKRLLFFLCYLFYPFSAWCAPLQTELVIALETNPPHFNPVLGAGSKVESIGAQLFAGLTRLSPKGRPLPYLATHWTHSPDYRSFTFFLHEGFFHDGTSITAEDVSFSILSSQKYHPFKPMLEPIRSIETPDAHTVTIRLSRPFPQLPAALIPSLVPILPRHIYGVGGPLSTHPANLHPVGSGPFMLETFLPNEYVRLVRNPRFFLSERPVLDRITYRIFWDEAELAPALTNGDVDIYLSPSPFLSRKIREEYPDIPLNVRPMEKLHAYICMTYNLDSPPLTDRRVREALSLSINREAFCRLSMLPIRPQQGPFPPGSPFYSPSSSSSSVDKSTAGRLLDEAGYPRGKDGKRFSIIIDVPPGSHSFVSLVFSMLAENLGALGIEVIPRYAIFFNEWANRLSTGNFQSSLDLLFAWHDPIIGIHRLYEKTIYRSLRSNVRGYYNPAAERLLLAASSESHAEKRQDFYTDFQRIVEKDHPMLWIAATDIELLYQPDILHLDELALGILSPMDCLAKKSTGVVGAQP